MNESYGLYGPRGRIISADKHAAGGISDIEHELYLFLLVFSIFLSSHFFSLKLSVLLDYQDRLLFCCI